jgi:hypothetical protein
MKNENDFSTSEIVWMIASITMIALMIFATNAFMVLLLPWLLWAMCKEIAEEYPIDSEENDNV